MHIDQIKEACPLWFSPNSMKFFNSRVHEAVYSGPGGVYFVTSEQDQSHLITYTRKYTVRQFHPKVGSNCAYISNIDFQAHDTRQQAHAEAKYLAEDVLV